MGTYRARTPEDDEELEKAEKEIEQEEKQESTEKVVDVAGEAALDYFTGGLGGAALHTAEAIPGIGPQVKNVWDSAVSAVAEPLSKTPIGDMAKQADDAGVVDAARMGLDLFNMAESGGAAGGAEAAGAASAAGAAGTAGGASAAGGALGGAGEASALGGEAQNALGGNNALGLGNNNEALGKNSMMGQPNIEPSSINPENISEEDLSSLDGEELDDAMSEELVDETPTDDGGEIEIDESEDDEEDDSSGGLLDGIFNVIKKSIRRFIIISVAVIFFFFIILFTIFANFDNHNLELTNTDRTTMTSKGGGSRACSESEIASKLIYVGDSRIVMLESAVNNSGTEYIAKVSMGHSWLVNEASSELDTKLNSNSNAIVVLALGVNDLHNIDKYITTYNELINKYPNAKFYILSVTPVEDDKASANGYSERNADIESFNSKLKAEFSDKYIDAYTNVSGYNTTDGIHYDNDTYKKINDYVLSTIKSSGKVSCGSTGDVLAKLEEVANWYITDVATYDQGLTLPSPFTSSNVRADCTGFAVAYMSYVAGVDIPISWSGEMVYPNGSWAQNVAQYGWIAHTSDDIGDLQPGDVMIAHGGVLYSLFGEHAEIYVDESHTFGWGSTKTKYPTDKTIQKTNENGHVHFKDSSHDYITIYRYEGETTSSTSSSGTNNTSSGDLNAKKMNDASFNHGTKPKSNQKYIMLHDTEMDVSAEAVANSWKNSKNGIAAHFVVGRDGSIVQTVDLDVIAHHAGWGGPGDFDSKFGVGNNDGKGSGDDLVGTTKKGYERYTSYGMNSYSIGIEMCHVNGQDYPEAQLNAVDKVIAYIDNYFGFKSKIIDHKDWRPSNSDTDANFSTYLSNYKSSRHH